MKNAIARFGKFLSAMVMPNIGAFIAWGFITALFIDTGWIPNADLASIQPFMLTFLLPVLIAAQGGKMVGGDRGRVMGAIAVMGCIAGVNGTEGQPMLMVIDGEVVTDNERFKAMLISDQSEFYVRSQEEGLEIVLQQYHLHQH